MVNDPEYIEKIVGKIKEIPAEEIIAAAKKVDLEDDIKIIEKFINICNEDLFTEISIKTDGLTKRAIENLVEEYKNMELNYKTQIEDTTILAEALGLPKDAPIDEMYVEIKRIKNILKERNIE